MSRPPGVLPVALLQLFRMLRADPGISTDDHVLYLSMPVRTQHDQLDNSIYFVTFTCYKWLSLIEMTIAYDTVYKWFDVLQEKKVNVTGYVIMPNHLHVLLHFPEMPKSLNTMIGNAKRFMAYAIIKRLEAAGENDLLEMLYAGVSKRERAKGSDIKYSKIVLMRRSAIQSNLLIRNWNICIITLCVANGALLMILQTMYIQVRHIMKMG